MPVADAPLVTRRGEQLRRVLADGLEHPEARFGGAAHAGDERRVEQVVERGHHVDVAGDGLERLERRAAAERTERPEHPPRVVVEQLDAPVERRAERALPLRQVARASGKEREPLAEALRSALGPERPRAGRRELEREREPVQRAADARHGGGVLVRDGEPRIGRTRALRVEADRRRALDRGGRHLAGLGNRQRRHRVDALDSDAERRAARDDHLQRRYGGDEARHVGGCVEHLLEVVQHEQRRSRRRAPRPASRGRFRRGTRGHRPRARRWRGRAPGRRRGRDRRRRPARCRWRPRPRDVSCRSRRAP